MLFKKKWLKCKDFITDWVRTLDRGLLWTIVSIIICGVFLTFSASPSVAERTYTTKDTFYLVRKQLVFLILSTGVILGVSMLSPKQIRRVSLMLFMTFFCLMICTLLFGYEAKGSRRWLSFPGGSIQPSEFIKPAFAVVCAQIFASGRLVKGFPGIPIASLIFLSVISILLLQPDVGMTITITAIWGSQLYLAGISLFLMCILGIVALAGATAVYAVFPHVQSRINRFFNPSSGDQVSTSLNAFQNAGWFGRGPGEGVFKNVLPDAHTDFILAVAAEEYGFLICSIVVFLFAFFVIRGFYLISKEKNLFNMFAVTGLLTQFGVQALINMASTLNVGPTKGMTLPLISYGGSSVFSIAFALGVVLSLTRRHPTHGGFE